MTLGRVVPSPSAFLPSARSIQPDSRSLTFRQPSSLSLTSDFQITYGSGSAVGYLATDTVELAGMTQTAQTFAVVTDTDAGLISNPISGLMGMGFKSLAQSGAAPWWSAVSSQWTSDVFAFRLARFRDVTGASSVEAEGGFVDL